MWGLGEGKAATAVGESKVHSRIEEPSAGEGLPQKLLTQAKLGPLACEQQSWGGMGAGRPPPGPFCGNSWSISPAQWSVYEQESKYICPLKASGDPLICLHSECFWGLRATMHSCTSWYCATQQGCIYTDLDVTGVLPRVEQGTTCTVIPVCHGHCGTAVFISKGAPWKC